MERINKPPGTFYAFNYREKSEKTIPFQACYEGPAVTMDTSFKKEDLSTFNIFEDKVNKIYWPINS